MYLLSGFITESSKETKWVIYNPSCCFYGGLNLNTLRDSALSVWTILREGHSHPSLIQETDNIYAVNLPNLNTSCWNIVCNRGIGDWRNLQLHVWNTHTHTHTHNSVFNTHSMPSTAALLPPSNKELLKPAKQVLRNTCPAPLPV